MPKYMFIFRGVYAPRYPILSPTRDRDAYLRKRLWYWAGELAKAGAAFRRATARQHGQHDRGPHTNRESDGPYTESKDLVVQGSLVIEADLARGRRRAGNGLSRL